MGQSKKDPSKLAEAEEAKAKVKANADRLAELEAKDPLFPQTNTLLSNLRSVPKCWTSS